MAEFAYKESGAVGSDKVINLPEIQMDPGSKWWIYCRWTEKGKEESGSWEITNDSMEGAYAIWRKEQWEQLFDPFNVKILSLTVSRIN